MIKKIFNFFDQRMVNFIYIILSLLLVTLLPVFSKMMDKNINSIQIVFFRYITGTVSIIIFILIKNNNLIETMHKTYRSISLLQIGRVVSGVLSLFFIFYASRHMTVVGLKCITYFAPIFGTFFSVLILNELISSKKIVSFCFCVLGIIIYFKPWEINFDINLAFYFAIFSAIFSGIENLFIKILSNKYSYLSIILFVNIFASIILIIPAIAVWTTPTYKDLFFLLLLGPTAVLSQFLYLLAVKYFNHSSIMSFSYFSILFSAVYGYLFFKEKIELLNIVSFLFIIFSGMITLFSVNHNNNEILKNAK